MTQPLSDTTITLMNAREILEKGWTQECHKDGDSYCIEGSLAAVYGLVFCLDHVMGKWPTGHRKNMDLIASVIGGIDAIDVPGWNDDPNRTHSEVLDVMDQAIQRSMEEG